MPPHKPSPHRFLAARAQPPSSSTTEKNVKGKAQSGLRHGSVPPAAIEASGQINTPVRKRFVIGSALPSPSQQPRPPTSGNRRRETLENEVEGKDRDGRDVTKVDPSVGTTRILTHTPQQRRVRPLKMERIESIEDPSPTSSPGVGGTQALASVEYSGVEGLYGIRHPHDEGGREQDMQDATTDVEMVDAMNEDGNEATNQEEEMLFESEQPPPMKRPRRTSPPAQPPISPPPPLPSSQHHQTPRPHPQIHTRTHSAHLQTPAPNPNPQRFRPATTASKTTSHPTTNTTTNNRPHFIVPSSSPSSPSKSATAATTALSNPLPEIFSPSRKRGRYVTDGLAACLQSWIVETADPLGQQDHLGAERDNTDARMRKMKRVRILGFSGDGVRDKEDEGVYARSGSVLFISAELLNGPSSRSETLPQLPSMTLPGDRNIDNSSQYPDQDHDSAKSSGPAKSIKIMLSGQGRNVAGNTSSGNLRRKSTGGVKLRIGDVLGLKPPLWEVDLGDGEMWVVGVEWVVWSSSGE
ncbi:hypothetical protein DM02DRAFT_730846 [Periconia macrospinosa]|uniref:Uncharacterized protein n=1 Tax=Periconia macrospinosa TaxID=97972 RepID=A0A2V1DIR7_9PLEO|nr:hypothetical protein DM02DRAFT_730846 [Periconia macrospinosa]